VFLYPLLGIKRGTSVTPDETYVSWNENYSSRGYEVNVCIYETRKDEEYKNFEANVLLKHSQTI
jgi:hypothetical protein